MFDPVHPGEIQKQDVLAEAGLSVAKDAENATATRHRQDAEAGERDQGTEVEAGGVTPTPRPALAGRMKGLSAREKRKTFRYSLSYC